MPLLILLAGQKVRKELLYRERTALKGAKVLCMHNIIYIHIIIIIILLAITMCIWHMLSAGMHSTRVCVHMHTRLGLSSMQTTCVH